jgi:sulfite reductase beta subunit-like hemoprotein
MTVKARTLARTALDGQPAIAPGILHAATAPATWADDGEVAAFDVMVQQYRQRRISPEEFKRFRLQHGVYGQRQDGLYMIRVKVPWGGLTAEHLAGLADIAQQTTDHVAHVTTRQNLQFYSLPPEALAEALSRLAEVGLTARESCGNTVRNVVACPHAGVAAEEPFDVTPYAEAAARFFLRNPMNQNLPRKFKISFSGCAEHCALPAVQDIGAVAVLREEAGVRHRGFRLYVGGGLGASPELAQPLEPFTAAEDLLLTLAAVVRVFDRTGNRENRNLARLKFVIRTRGVDAFRDLVEKERSALRWGLAGAFPPVMAPPEPRRPEAEGAEPELPLHDPGFGRWWRTNVRAQKQAGYSTVSIRLPLGDISAPNLRVLAFATQQFADGWARTTNQQNFLLRWVPTFRLPELFRLLRASRMAAPGAERLADVTACAGRETCQVGITSSRGLAAAVASVIEERCPDLADDPGLRVKVSGCPNSCGHHHLAAIGFAGGAKEYAGRQVAAYQVYVGGGLGAGATRFAAPFARVPAKNAPALVERLLALYRKERLTGEPFDSVVRRLGAATLRGTVSDLLELPPHAVAPDAYLDWDGRHVEAASGEGECAS